MESAELQALLRQGEIRASITFDDAVRDSIVTLSKGMPYHAHLLALVAGRHAISRNSRAVREENLRAAVSDILGEIDPNVIAAYERATAGESNQFMTDILFAAAVAPFDTYGQFRADGVLMALKAYTGRPSRILNVHGGLARLSKNREARILERSQSSSGAVIYGFVNPLMRQFVLFRQAERRGMLASRPL
jgi:hypothetical protein